MEISQLWLGQASCRIDLVRMSKTYRKARRSLLISIFFLFSIQLQQCYTQLLSTNGSAPTIELHNASITNRKGDNLHVQAVGQQWQAVSLPKGETQDCCEPVCDHARREYLTESPHCIGPYIACEFVTWKNNKTIDMEYTFIVIIFTRLKIEQWFRYILYCTCWTFKSYYIFFSSECNLYLL